jgi:hypothetical protein
VLPVAAAALHAEPCAHAAVISLNASHKQDGAQLSTSMPAAVLPLLRPDTLPLLLSQMRAEASTAATQQQQQQQQALVLGS